MDTEQRRLRDRISTGEFLLALIGTTTVGMALILAIDPTLIDPAFAELLSEFDAEIDTIGLLLLVTLIFAFYGLWRVAFPGSTDLDDPPELQPAQASAVDHVIGADLTATIAETIEALHRGELTDPNPHRDEFHQWFVNLCERCGKSRSEAEQLIASGKWTDDTVAAIFLAGDDVGEYPFVERLRGWLFPASRFKYRLERFLDACDEYSNELIGAEPGNDVTTIEDETPMALSGLAQSSTESGVYRLSRWQSGVIASITFVGAGFYYGLSSLFLMAIIPLGYLGYAAISGTPDPYTTLEIKREASTRTPLPGEPVTVTVSIRNTGDSPMTDVRIADRIPDELRVIDGTAVAGFSLRGGEERTIEYTLRPRRGTHAFGPLVIRIRNLSGTAVSTAELEPDGDTELSCRVPVEDVPVHQETISRVGSVPTSKGGPGMEFHSTREYRFGDPPRWIDWRRLARTDELGTINYRLQEATTAILLIDGRTQADVVAAPGNPDGVTLSVYAGVLLARTLIDSGHRVGLAGLGVKGSKTAAVYPGPPIFVPPEEVGIHAARIARVCDMIAEPENRQRAQPVRLMADRLDQLVPPGAQLLMVSPLVDDDSSDLVTELRRRGYQMTVLSPNLTGATGTGARLERFNRVSRTIGIRRVGVPVIDWDPNERLHLTIERMRRADVLVS